MDLPVSVRPGVYQKAISGCFHVAAAPRYQPQKQSQRPFCGRESISSACKLAAASGAACFSVWQLIL
jgi:hypothetical protein